MNCNDTELLPACLSANTEPIAFGRRDIVIQETTVYERKIPFVVAMSLRPMCLLHLNSQNKDSGDQQIWLRGNMG